MRISGIGDGLALQVVGLDLLLTVSTISPRSSSHRIFVRSVAAIHHSGLVKTVAKLSALSVGIVLLLVVLGLGIERLRGWWGLRSYTKHLLDSGERLDVAQLEPTNRPSRDRNGLVALVALTNQLKGIRSVLDEAPPIGRLVATGAVALPQRLNRWPVDKRTNAWETWDPKMEAQMDLLDQIHKALQKSGFDLGVDYRGGFDQDKTVALRCLKDTGKLLALSAIRETRAGRLSVAHERLLDNLRLAEALKSERWVITQLVRRAIILFAWNVQFAMLSEEGWTELQMKEQQAAWRRLAPVSDLISAFGMERAMQPEAIRQLVANADNRRRAFENQKTVAQIWGWGEEEEESVLDDVLKRVQPHFWKYVWHDQDQLRSLRNISLTIDDCRKAQTEGWQALPVAASSEIPVESDSIFGMEISANKWERFCFPFSSGPKVYTSALRQLLGTETQIQLAIAALAAHRYRMTQGAWPASLKDLGAQELKNEPRDPVGGGTLVYRRDSARGFQLYSKGENGQDDGGNPAMPNSSSGFEKLSLGKDSVWPRAATLEEAEAALFKSRHSKSQ